MNIIIKDVEDCELDCATDARSVTQLIGARWSGAAVVSLGGDDR
jgi:4-hydroxybenzoate polyprenyltransferase